MHTLVKMDARKDLHLQASDMKLASVNKRVASQLHMGKKGPGGTLVIEWGWATGWGHIFATGFTIMRLYFQWLLEWYQEAHFQDFEGKKTVVDRDLKMGRFVVKKVTESD